MYEIEKVTPGPGFTARDLRTGDRVTVRERTASRSVKTGMLICARLVPAGETVQCFGGMEPVALHERDAAARAARQRARRPDDWSSSSPAASPRPCCRTPKVRTSPSARPRCAARRPGRSLAAALDDTYDRVDGDGALRWFEHVTTYGRPRIRATLTLDGHTLLVETNSVTRMDRVLATLARLDPAMNVLNDSRRPLRDAREAAELAKQLPTAGDALDPDDPELPSTRSSATTRRSGSTNPSPRSTATPHAGPPMIPLDAAT